MGTPRVYAIIRDSNCNQLGAPVFFFSIMADTATEGHCAVYLALAQLIRPLTTLCQPPSLCCPHSVFNNILKHY